MYEAYNTLAGCETLYGCVGVQEITQERSGVFYLLHSILRERASIRVAP